MKCLSTKSCSQDRYILSLTSSQRTTLIFWQFFATVRPWTAHVVLPSNLDSQGLVF